MLLVLLLLLPVTCEWVEISQNHHRPSTFRKLPIGLATENHIYPNSSIPDIQWTKAVMDRVPNVGNVQKTSSTIVNKISVKANPGTENDLNKEKKFKMSQSRNKESVNLNRRMSNDWQIKLKGSTSVDSDEMGQWVHVSTKAPKLTEVNKLVGREKLMPSHTQSNMTQSKFAQNKFESNEATFEFILKEFDNLNKKELHVPSLFSKMKNHTNITSVQVIETASNENVNQRHVAEVSKLDENEAVFSNLKLNNEIKSPQAPVEKYISTEETKDRLQNEGDKLEPPIDSVSSSNSKDKMWQLIQVITDTISKNTKKGFKSKVKYLEDLKNIVLVNIEERIDSTWPDNHQSRQSRAARSAEDRGHVEFPSSEGALMTISFLTFAVFLVKLVLQVIHTYKSKTMMVAPAVVTAMGRAIYSLKTKNKL